MENPSENPSVNASHDVEVQTKRPRGRPRFPQRQGLTGLTPVEYRRIYQKDYYKEHPRKPKSPAKPAKSNYVKKAPEEQKKRGRRREFTDEEREQRKQQYMAKYYQKNREKVLESCKQRQAKKRDETEETIQHLKNLVGLYELLTILRHHKKSAAGHPADEV